MNPTPPNPYDQVLYNSRPSPGTHPDHLETLAALFGMRPAPSERCSVLELGCGNGANLIPMALVLPGSRFVGIDLAAAPIEAAQALAGGLRLNNISFHQLDIAGVDPGFGLFDYLIAHGIYSWVPPAARETLLAVCRANLAPHGVAFVSYNTFPGCHVRQMMREMLLYQTRGITDPDLRLKHAYAMLNFLHSSNPRSAALREELNAIRSRDPSVVFHDDLQPVNDPVYFHQFIDHARAHHLQFLAEAEFSSMQSARFDPETVKTLRLLAGNDRIREQQYLDFLKCRRFRETLLCHEGTPLRYPPPPRLLCKFNVSSRARPVRATPDVPSDAEEEFQTADGASITTNLPLAKAAILHLGKCWPLAVPFEGLLSAARAALGTGAASRPEDATVLADLLLRIYASGLAELRLAPSRFSTRVSERPRAFSLARVEATNGHLVTTLHHTQAKLEDPIGRKLVTLLDASRDHASILRDLDAALDPDERNGPLREEDLERSLIGLARMALLEA